MSLVALRAVAVMAAAGFGLSACQGADGQPSSSPPNDQVSSIEPSSVKRFARLFGGYSADYEPFETAKEMEAASQLVLKGTIADIRPGRILYAESLDNPEAAQALVMEVAWTEVVTGEEPTEGSVYLELPSGGRDASEFEHALPVDASVGLYLVPARNESGDLPIGDEDAGRPEGAPLWVPVNPQGFVIATGSAGTVATPLDPGVPIEGDVAGVAPGE